MYILGLMGRCLVGAQSLEGYPTSVREGTKEAYEMPKSKGYRPGETVPTSGQAEIIGPGGKPTGIERTVTKGEPFPPTLRPGQTFKIVDETKHRRRSK